MVEIKRICKICGTEFIAYHPNKLCCSASCSRENNKRCLTEKRKIEGNGNYHKPSSRKKRKSQLTELNNEARDKGMTYGQLRAKETVELFGRVEI